MHTTSMKTPPFQRRKDINIKDRFLIAYHVKYRNNWGLISRLADKYNVSRVFIYNTSDKFSSHLEQAFGDNKPVVCDNSSLKSILLYRMDGKCSIVDISVLLQRFGIKYTSVGYISEKLSEIGKTLGNTLDLPDVECFTFAVCSDEIFSNGRPILISVDPKSLLILNIELADKRDAEAWTNHFQTIKEQDINITQLIKDEGLGLRAAQQTELPNVAVQSDTFHAVAHRFGLFVNRFLAKAYKFIDNEYECDRLFWGAKSEQNCQKRYDNYWQATLKTHKAIDLYENFQFLYHCLLECFQPFDNKGNLKDVNKVTEDFDTALELLKQLNISEINAEIKSIENCKSDLFTFFHSAKDICQTLAQSFDIGILKPLCLAWQCKKNWIKAKNSKRREWFKNKELHLLNHVKERCENDFTSTYNAVYKQLDNIIQSSAAVECINSLLRPYLNSMKGNVTQEFLNLFMFYHNHHRFNSGLRKGKSPFEIATDSKNQKDWLNLVLQKIELSKTGFN